MFCLFVVVVVVVAVVFVFHGLFCFCFCPVFWRGEDARLRTPSLIGEIQIIGIF